jgi:hypothetical protein
MDASPRLARGNLYLNQRRRKVWQQVVAIAHEEGRTEEEAVELLATAARLAVEQHVARKAEKS